MINIEKDIKILEESIQEAYRSYDYDLDYNPFSKGIAEVIERVLAERKQDKERIQKLEEEKKTMCEEYCPKTERIKELEEENKKLLENSLDVINDMIPKQKVKDVLTEIQEEYNKVQEQFDYIWSKKSKDDYERYKLQELSAMQQELGFILKKLEELLEEK